MSFLSYVASKLQTRVKNVVGAINELETSKQGKLTAGANITIVNDVISSTGGGGDGTAYKMYPDLSKQENINRFPGTTRTWTADRYGYINIAAHSTSNSVEPPAVRIDINGVEVSQAAWTADLAETFKEVWLRCVLDIALGDVITLHVDDPLTEVYGRFVPPRFVVINLSTDDIIGEINYNDLLARVTAIEEIIGGNPA